MRVEIPQKRYFKIGEVSQLTGVEPHTIRYWESEFRQLKPKRAGSRQRLYRRDDVRLIDTIRILLHDEKYTIAGAKRRLKKGPSEAVAQPRAISASNQAEAVPEPAINIKAPLEAETEPEPAQQAPAQRPPIEAEPVEPERAQPPAKTRQAKPREKDDHPVLFPGLNRNGINSAGASILIRVKSELKEILELLS